MSRVVMFVAGIVAAVVVYSLAATPPDPQRMRNW